MIQTFTYRNPRLLSRLPIEFATATGTLFGFTRNLSASGMLVDFGEPQRIGDRGLLRFRIGRSLFEVQASVGHMDGFLSGMIFDFRSDQESTYVQSALEELQRGYGLLQAP